MTAPVTEGQSTAQPLYRDLTLGYDQKSILEHLNFEVNARDYLCVVGESDSGKNMLMKTILGLQPSPADTVERGDSLRADEVGYLPQQTLVQHDFPASIEEIVFSGRQGRTGFQSFYRKTDRESAEKNMERMGIAAFWKHHYREFSGGQQQRVLLVRVLCVTEKMLLLDELVSDLNPRVTADMYQLIQGLNEEGIIVTVISYDIAAATQYASHTPHIDKEVLFGTKERYRRSRLGEWFLQEEGVNV